MIRIKNISLYYDTVQGTVKAVEDVSFELYDGEIVGIAGESGCGKSTLMKGIYGNVERPMYIASGSIELEVDTPAGKEIIPSTEFHRYWWQHISYIPQASMSVLNPVMRIRDQFLDSFPKEMARDHGKAALIEAMSTYLQELDLPATVLDAYPHQLSGGMRQRVIVAMATFVQICAGRRADHRARCGGAAGHPHHVAQVATEIGQHLCHGLARHGRALSDHRPHGDYVRRQGG
jgi:peptide/nickel transport system ATP-binding protein